MDYETWRRFDTAERAAIPAAVERWTRLAVLAAWMIGWGFVFYSMLSIWFGLGILMVADVRLGWLWLRHR